MRKRLRHLSTLVAFEAVADLGSFTKAGDALCLTHSAISHQIRQLEEHVGIRLLQRLPSGVTVTAEGAAYLAEVRAALKLLEDAEAALRRQAATRALRISVLPSFAGSAVVPELLSFLEQNPTVRVEIDARPNLEDDDNSDIDVFIRYGKGDWSGFESTRLMDVELYPVCSPSYLEKHGTLTRINDLSRVVMLRHTMEPWEAWLRAVSAEAAHTDECFKDIIPAGPLYTDARLMLLAACDGQGVALARDVLAEPDIQAGRLVRLFQVRVASPRGYYAFYRPDAMSRPAARLFIAWLVDTCRRLHDQSSTGR
ncbi:MULTISPECIES: LysR substrate-binding domain-containing protein [unclassified Variovorax]|uniref:LysR substrate-binding domain-containing protein n=1 Tax=unclassified Variovorax TaxID=663243 RepID=UPI00076D5E9C|nr:MULTISPECIES: LysR substrate-binding domain-containing protein [unclassified Variovorax]KWT95801.1 Glycine cleavage system transcriptional activator [Variovorax sp. WDL1]PNG58834.1 Glycine cleavage system transcriptional activator [Variovorax sp. B4]PNG61376.1 Glycine cleavage system transcriptional activator [Variovorax sp. B2]VTV12623.1 Gcv operon activator [Variovorax sp. WDL1]